MSPATLAAGGVGTVLTRVSSNGAYGAGRSLAEAAVHGINPEQGCRIFGGVYNPSVLGACHGI